MSMRLRRFLSFVLCASMLLALVSCAKDAPLTDTADDVVSESSENQVTEPESVPEPEPEPALPENMNPLTGLECDPDLVGKRPVAIMFNNLREALPQNGLSSCDIIYEVLAEGGILRLEGVLQDYKSVEKFGSIRSARPYYVEIASSYDAIYVHAGRSDLAAQHLKNLNVNNLNGVEGPGGAAFYRDQNRLNSGYATEHTMFSSGEKIAAVIDALKYRTDLNNKEFSAFSFDPELNKVDGTAATYIKIPHSYYSVSEFKFNATDNLYYHYQYNGPHMDEANGKQIAATNLFLLFADHKINPDGKTLNINLTGEGKGYYAVGGEMVPIIWKRASNTSPFTYYNTDGTELKVACGKSYVSIADSKIYSAITIS